MGSFRTSHCSLIYLHGVLNEEHNGDRELKMNRHDASHRDGHRRRAGSMTDLCIRCASLPATDREWPHCEDCYQLMMNEIHEAECEQDAAERADERRVRRAVMQLALWRWP